MPGIALGDVLIYSIGTGWWQIAVAVGSEMVVTQVAISAVLVATVMPPQEGICASRAIDSLLGGASALVVIAPLPPVTH